MLGTALISDWIHIMSSTGATTACFVAPKEMAESSVIDYREKKQNKKKQSVHSPMAISLNWIFASVPINTNQQAAY